MNLPFVGYWYYSGEEGHISLCPPRPDNHRNSEGTKVQCNTAGLQNC